MALSPQAIRKAMGFNPLAWVQGTAVGQMAPFFLLALLLVGVWGMGPTQAGLRQLLLIFGLVGLVSLGATFPLLKGQYDFAAGPLAGLTACLAALLSPYGALPALLGALAVGCLVGLLNGWLSGWTRVGSAMVTIITGVMALHVTLFLTARMDLAVTDPLLTALGDTYVVGVPVVLVLFVLAMIAAKVLLRQPTFWPVGGAPSSAEAAARGSAENVLLAFMISGLMAGLAGVLIASSGFTALGASGSAIWLLTPLAAALIGGASVAGGSGNLRTAAIGAGVVATTNWLTAQLGMPTSGPVAEMPYLVIGLLADRWKNMTWYMIVQLRRGNLLALPAEMRLPMVLRLWRRTSWATRLVSLALVLVIAGGLYLYVSLYAVTRVPEGTAAVLDLKGVAQVTRAGSATPVPLAQGASLRPGDRVTVGRASEALLRLCDGSQLRVYANSEMYLTDLSSTPTGGNTTHLAVTAGNVFAKVRKLVNRQSSFTVDSPVLTLGVRGTTFELGVDQRRGRVAVGEGTVEVKRQFFATDAETGETRAVEDTQRLAERQSLETERGRARLKLEFLQPQEVQRLQLAKWAIEQDNKSMYTKAIKSNTIQGLIFGAIVLYLAFLIYLRPEPPGYLPDILAKRAKEFEAIHRATPHDPSRSAALAQMYLRAGDAQKAEEELRAILEHDPRGEYGQWASRMRTQLGRKGPKQK
jgi:ribose/xylose/arabinose/galactoside ABC-type transport system permease subunit/ferric-dicitrate binding protein FerR (iron transport regulator)